MRSTLKTREDRLIYSALYIVHNLFAVFRDTSDAFPEENNASARASEELNKEDIILVIMTRDALAVIKKWLRTVKFYA